MERPQSETWLTDQVRRIAEADDLHISPFRETVDLRHPTWIWSVAVDDDLYVRAYYRKNSRWYQAAVREKAPEHYQGSDLRAVEGAIYERIDDAYRGKYLWQPISQLDG